MKTIYKVFAVLMIAVSMFVIMPENMSMAADTAGTTASSAIDTVQKETSSSAASGASTDLAKVIGKLLGFLQIASGIVAVLMIAIVGFNYIIATPDVKDEMKKKMLQKAIV